jgi:hypothetical protein
MKNFRNSILAAAALVFGLTSCNSDEIQHIAQSENQITVRIANPSSRAIGAPGNTTDVPEIINGYIFVTAPVGAVVHGEVLNVTNSTSAAGQRLAGTFNHDVKVYIVANIPTSIDLPSLVTLEAIKAAFAEMSTQIEYLQPAMANHSGDAQNIRVVTEPDGSVPGVAEVAIQLSPLYARLELGAVTGTGAVRSFTVTGVYVDEFRPQFTLEGKAHGALHQQGASINFAGIPAFFKTETNVAATASGTNWVATPAGTNVWFNHVPATTTPRFIVRLENLHVADQNGTPQPADGGATHYLTVTGYSDSFPNGFERGRIYRIPSIDFNESEIAVTPNVQTVTLNVKVEVLPWTDHTLSPIL